MLLKPAEKLLSFGVNQNCDSEPFCSYAFKSYYLGQSLDVLASLELRLGYKPGRNEGPAAEGQRLGLPEPGEPDLGSARVVPDAGSGDISDRQSCQNENEPSRNHSQPVDNFVAVR